MDLQSSNSCCSRINCTYLGLQLYKILGKQTNVSWQISGCLDTGEEGCRGRGSGGMDYKKRTRILLWEMSIYYPNCDGFISVSSQFSRSVVSSSLWPRGLQHARLPYHQLPELTQTHVHRVGDAIQPSHPLLTPSSPALNLSQHQGLPVIQFFTSGG